MTYNGYANYATWAVSMFLDGNYDGIGTYLEALDIARESDNEHELSQALKIHVEECMPDLGASLASDLLRASLSDVDWQELAEYKMEEIAEESEDE